MEVILLFAFGTLIFAISTMATVAAIFMEHREQVSAAALDVAPTEALPTQARAETLSVVRDRSVAS